MLTGTGADELAAAARRSKLWAGNGGEVRVKGPVIVHVVPTREDDARVVELFAPGMEPRLLVPALAATGRQLVVRAEAGDGDAWRAAYEGDDERVLRGPLPPHKRRLAASWKEALWPTAAREPAVEEPRRAAAEEGAGDKATPDKATPGKGAPARCAQELPAAQGSAGRAGGVEGQQSWCWAQRVRSCLSPPDNGYAPGRRPRRRGRRSRAGVLASRRSATGAW